MCQLSSFLWKLLILLQICIGLSIVNSDPKPQLDLPPLKQNLNQSDVRARVFPKSYAVKIIKNDEVEDESVSDDGSDEQSVEINGKLGVSSDYDREKRQRYGQTDYDRDRSQRFGPPYSDDERNFNRNNNERYNDYYNQSYNGRPRYNNDDDKYYTNPLPRDRNVEDDKYYANPAPRDPNYDDDRERYGNRGPYNRVSYDFNFFYGYLYPSLSE